MIEKLIKSYVSKLTLDEVDKFAKENGVILNDDELNMIFIYIKRDWKTIVHGNPRGILDDIKSKLDSSSYSKIENLYIFFKNKYQNYL